MARRIIQSILFSCLLFAASGLQAQVWTPQNNQAGTMPALFSSKRSGYPDRTQYGGATDAAVPLNYATPRTAVPGVPYYGPDDIATTRVPPQPDWAELSPLEAMLQTVFQKSWYRLEYLNWNVNRPGNKLLGERLSTVANPNESFPVFDQQIPANEIGTAFVPSLSSVRLHDIDGLRGTIGIPTSFGAIEASFFALNQANGGLSVPGLRPHEEELLAGGLVLVINPGLFAGTSLLENGEPSDLVELYNRSFRVTYKTDMLGAEANFVTDNLVKFGNRGGLEIQPMFGFRYLLIQEEMIQAGQFEDISGAVPLLTSVITSGTSNNLFGPSFGTRVEFQHERFTLGVNPKMTLATNAYSTKVNTERFRSAGDPTVRTTDRSVNFSPVGELQAYARIGLSDNIWFSVGYTMMYVSQLTRPHDNIRYNDNGGLPTPPGVVGKTKLTYMTTQGLNLGLEIILP